MIGMKAQQHSGSPLRHWLPEHERQSTNPHSSNPIVLRATLQPSPSKEAPS